MQTKRRSRVAAGLFTAAALMAGMPALAGAPVAIVEDVNAPSTKLQLMEYLEQGQSFTLNPGETITLSYFNSCSVERIAGGRVKVGYKKSQISGGKVESENVPCGGGGIVLTERQSDQSAGIVFRSLDFADKDTITVYSVSPLFVLSAAADEVVIQEQGGKKQTFNVKTKGETRIDLNALGIKLSQGATYSASAGASKTTFKVADTATASTRSVISRLIGL